MRVRTARNTRRQEKNTARYANTAAREGTTIPIASLEMEDCLHNKPREDGKSEPAFSPSAAVNGPMHLFTGLNPDSDETGNGGRKE